MRHVLASGGHQNTAVKPISDIVSGRCGQRCVKCSLAVEQGSMMQLRDGDRRRGETGKHEGEGGGGGKQQTQ